MGIGFTDEQKRAIEARNADILVSAAAGSGKTAVLVERIMGIITDSDVPVDIDNLLIVTFTSAAAAEMRERIGKALTELAENTSDEHILRQLTLINHADITTIHSFCMKIVRENYTKLNIDPDFRIADENECDLIKNTVLEEIFEEKYGSEENDEFLSLVETFGESLGDGRLKDLVLSLYDFIQSMPFPEKYLDEACKNYDFDIETPFEDTVWGQYIKNKSLLEINEYIKCIDKALNLALKNGPDSYAVSLSDDLKNLNNICEKAKEGFAGLSRAVSEISFKAIGRTGKNDDKENAEIIKSLRETVKNGVNDLKERFFSIDLETETDDIIKTGYVIKALSDITKEFSKRFAEEKRQKNIADFNDLEHFALKILIDEKDGEYLPSNEAIQLQKKYYEVMTDEYQDSNPVQEMILFAVSGRGESKHNRFMVGDVKQSIYRFRQAEPGLFLEKYNTYSSSGDSQRIDLFKNFRSRKEILDGINFIFRQLMTKETGEMDYTKDDWLYAGAQYPKSEDSAIEIDIIEKNSSSDDDTEDISAAEAEMRFVAKRIRELFESGFKVYDIKNKEYRALKYSDIAIIMRKTKNWARIAKDALDELSVPSYMESSEKYFERREVSDILNMLSVIDNSRQDIPLIASLKIPYYGVTDDELLRIKMADNNADFYTSAMKYMSESHEKQTVFKLENFFNDINKWKKNAPYMSVGELIWDIYSSTGYYDYAGALKGGDLKQANLMMLIEKADELEKNNFKGLFNFIRYVDRLQKNGYDFGGTGSIGEGTDAVRIMTVHKSKGLEFPVVFLCAVGSRFNKSDISSPLLMHRKMGLACDYRDIENRFIRRTVSKSVIADKINMENIAEEMRVLYVAMTRAKEKLIITGSASNIDKKRSAWSLLTGDEKAELPYYAVSGASYFLDWLCICAARHKDGGNLRYSESAICSSEEIFNDVSKWKINILSKDTAADSACIQEETDENVTVYSDIWNIDPEERLSWQYNGIRIPANLYVSEIKRLMDGTESDSKDERLYSDAGFKEPEFLRKSEKISASQRGTAVHSVLQNMDFRNDYTYDSIKNLIGELTEKGILTKPEADSIYIKSIKSFADSEIYSRIKSSGKAYKEKPFAMEMTPYEIFGDKKYLDCEDSILVHGMIDCFFIEDNEIVLIDYKTDYVEKGKEEILKDRYSIQLRLYKTALERSMGMNVKETCIFALSTGKEIKI